MIHLQPIHPKVLHLFRNHIFNCTFSESVPRPGVKKKNFRTPSAPELNNKSKGEDKRCSFRQTGVEWEQELTTREDVAIEIDLEVGANITEDPICVVGHVAL